MIYDNAVLKHHCRPSRGWVNDPNGLVFYKGYYHIFYQHARTAIRPWKEPISWGHSRTKDFLSFEELPDAILPGSDGDYDSFGCWSGTAAVKDGTLYLFYASVKLLEDGSDVQTISVAYSTDGVHFEKYAKNPVIPRFPADGCRDFRDPAVLLNGEDAYLVMASANEAHTCGRLLLYKSRDLLGWEYTGVLAEWQGCKYAECPSFIKLDGGGYLLAASLEDNGTGDKHFYVMYGDFDGKTFTPRVKGEPQKGPDQYAGQVFKAPDGRAVLISWIPGWHYSQTFDACVGCMSLPMELTVGADGRVRAFPVKECRPLLADGDGSIEYTKEGFVIKRKSEPDVICRAGIKELKVLRDGYIIEVFVNGGEEVYSAVLC